MRRAPWLLVLVLAGVPSAAGVAENDEIDAATLRHKILCGYQGWFRCPGDVANEGWQHWSRDAGTFSSEA